MKRSIKKFIVANIIVMLLKVIASYVCKSYTILVSGLYELLLIFSSLFVNGNKDNKKYKTILTSVLSFLFIIGSIGLSFLSVISSYNRSSLFIILFVVIALLVRYVVSCFNTNSVYSKKEGIIAYSNINSNLEFLHYGVIIGAMILSYIGKWFDICKYGDKIGTILISLIVIIKSVKILANGFKYVQDQDLVINDDVLNELKNRKEIKKVNSISYNNFGGFRKINLVVEFSDNLSLIDLNTFIVTLSDYLLKFAEVIHVELVKKKENIYKKVIRNARNSRSGNSKANAKKTNSRKKNKKR